MNRLPGLFASILCLSLLAVATPAQSIHFVDRDAVGFNDGSSWADAFTDLQLALALDKPGDEIRVAQGTYVPGPTPLNTFTVDPGVTLNGGYAGYGESDPDKRDIDAYVTVLSGDVLGNDGPAFTNRADNSQRVVTGGTGSQPVVIRGFTIRAGNAPLFGGGIYMTFGLLELHRVKLTDNFAAGFGAGMFINGSQLDMLKCEVTDNLVNYPTGLLPPGADVGGAGIFTLECSATIVGCLFESNLAVVNVDPLIEIGGVGAALEGGTLAIVKRCRFVGNVAQANLVAGGRGAGLGVLAQAGVVTDCDFIDNHYNAPAVNPFDGGGGAWVNGFVRVSNSRFLGNSASQAFGGGLAVGDVYLVGLPPSVENCEFTGNAASGAGGLFPLSGPFAPIPVVGNTFYGNSAAGSGGGIYTPGLIDVDNSVFWANTDSGGVDESAQIHTTGPAPFVDHTAVQGLTGGLGGTGNTGSNPLLVDPDGADNVLGTGDDDVRLSSSSPCIDAAWDFPILGDQGDLDGDFDTAERSPLDAGGLMRRVDDPLTPDTGSGPAPIVDMGAHEYGSVLPTQQWTVLGGALAGTYGAPVLDGRGTLAAGQQVLLTLSNALENSSANLFIGFLLINQPFKGGTLVPSADILFLGLPTGPFGTLALGATWPELVPPGASFFMQHWVADPVAPLGFSASNAVGGVTP